MREKYARKYGENVKVVRTCHEKGKRLIDEKGCGGEEN